MQMKRIEVTSINFYPVPFHLYFALHIFITVSTPRISEAIYVDFWLILDFLYNYMFSNFLVAVSREALWLNFMS